MADRYGLAGDAGRMMRAMLLAAGRGERMRPLTDDIPKPLLEVGGRALIEHHLARLTAAGFEEVVVNLAWQGDRIRARLGDGGKFGLSLSYSEEGGSPIGTAAGIARALPLLGDAPFAVINADVWTDYPFERLHLPAGRAAHLVLVPNPPHKPGGDFRLLDSGAVVAVGTEHGSTDDDGSMTFAGIGVYSPSLFSGLSPRERELAPVLRAACARGEVSGERWDGAWDDIGTPERLEALRRHLAR